MSERTVWIEFDDDRRLFEPGDKIVGTVYVQVDRAQDSARVSLSRKWRTSGRPGSRSGGSDEILLFEGKWDSEGTYEYPFIFHVPPGPYTYHGHLVNVDWFLCAEVDFDSAESVSSEEKFVVEAAGDEREFIVGDTSGASDDRSDQLTGPQRVLWGLGSLLLTLVGLWLLYPNVAALPGASWATMLAAAGCLGLAGWSAKRLYTLTKDDDDPRVLAPTPDDYQVEPGDYVSFVVELQPNFKTSPKGIIALLKGYEHIMFDDGESTHADVHRFYEEAIPIEATDEGELQNGHRSSYRVSFRMPADAPYSFYCPNASVTWAIEVHVDVGSWPDWRKDFPIVVRPCVGDGRLRAARSYADRGELG